MRDEQPLQAAGTTPRDLALEGRGARFLLPEGDPSSAWERYLSLWGWDPDRHRVALEASTSYAKYPLVKGVPERIATVRGVTFKFIYIVRDPVMRIASQVRQSLYGGWGRSLDDGLTPDLIDFSRYAMQADRYATHFPRDDMLILTLDDLQHSPAELLERASSFLGISPGHAFEDLKEPRNTGYSYAVAPLVAGLARAPVGRSLLQSLVPRRARRWLRRWDRDVRRPPQRGVARPMEAECR